MDEHNKNLKTLLQRLLQSGLKINPKKCKFAVIKIIFNGHILSAEGISPDPEKIKSINQLQVPTNITEIKSPLGMTNFCNKFIPDYSTITAPLRQLTKKDKPFRWGPQQQAALDQLKQLLTSVPVLTFYNPNAATKIYVDISPRGLGAVLTQKQQYGYYQPIAYGSRALTPIESLHSQTEREGLAVVWSCQHFHYDVYDNKTTIITDHKPLEKLLSSTSNPTPRIQRWILQLQAYDTMIQYRPGSLNPADYLSRHPSLPSHQLNDQSAEHYINMITYYAAPKSISIEHLRILHYNELLNPFKQTTGLNIYNHSTQYATNSVFTTRSY